MARVGRVARWHTGARLAKQGAKRALMLQVGQKLSDVIVKRVMTGAVCVLLVVRGMSLGSTDAAEGYATRALQAVADMGSAAALNAAAREFVRSFEHTAHGRPRLLYLHVPVDGTPRVVFSRPLASYRSCELQIQVAIPEGPSQAAALAAEAYDPFETTWNDTISGLPVTVAVFSHRETLQYTAILDLTLKVLVVLLLWRGVTVFNKDTTVLVLTPLDRMMAAIKAAYTDPINSFQGLRWADQKARWKAGDSESLMPGARGGIGSGDVELRMLEGSVMIAVLLCSVMITVLYQRFTVLFLLCIQRMMYACMHVVRRQMALSKITGLLRVCYGEAGSSLIGDHLKRSIATGPGSLLLDPSVPGKRVFAIFGFCSIHDFEHITEALQNDIMKFVNSVAAIVHTACSAWSGHCNKNLGRCWLEVWRIGDSEHLQQLSHLASINGALIGMLKVIYQLINSNTIRSFETRCNAPPTPLPTPHNPHPGDSTDSLDSDSDHPHHPPFRINMGFGLHVGWAIEGAVGSDEKVEATYLSPHVNMSARMETAARQYGVEVLLSGDFYELLSTEAQRFCRLLDVVVVKGSHLPMPIYTYDTYIGGNCDDEEDDQSSTCSDTSESEPESAGSAFVHEDAQATSTTGAQQPQSAATRDLEYEMMLEAEQYSIEVWTKDRQLVELRRKCTQPFIAAFDRGVKVNNEHQLQLFEIKFKRKFKLKATSTIIYQPFIAAFDRGVKVNKDTGYSFIGLYLAGDWKRARVSLEEADRLKVEVGCSGGDGPARTLLAYMLTHKFKSPVEWRGYRELDSK
ncbi:hypothetical protein JKP88DRAFT_250870 [Tribonema minus]|uniref:Guanylate cyclase domain-containing protein n=1 Tax=Tribonema minus TaxID=303371 RepID=A0A835ZG93_9STRA|nr:hypothetical protein JKP88DRAFT_250870 [Tribonema minus]